MRFKNLYSIWALVGLTVLVGSGCTSGDRIEVYPVQGKVSFAGKPMSGGGAIAFVPIGDQRGKAAGGMIDQSGAYTLTTFEPGDGSMSGEFRVIINQTVFDEPETNVDSDAGASKEDGAVATVPKADRIPLIYSDPTNSPLTAKVEAKSLNEIDFALQRR
ncbi:MAG: hypothetical protein ACTHOU_13675 [Aureliella sp.]